MDLGGSVFKNLISYFVSLLQNWILSDRAVLRTGATGAFEPDEIKPGVRRTLPENGKAINLCFLDKRVLSW